MRVVVVTPYFKEPIEKLRRCHQSVAAQTHPCDHVMVADGFPQADVATWPVSHIVLPPHDDLGDTPRLIGAASAVTRGQYEAVCLLDADNWFEPDHVETLVRRQRETGAAVVTSTRMLRRLDGSQLGVCGESDGERFADTNCLLITRPAFGAFIAWGFKDRRFAVVGDKIFWKYIVDRQFKRSHSQRPTVNYETTFAVHYLARNEEPPENAKVIHDAPELPYPRFVPYRGGMARR